MEAADLSKQEKEDAETELEWRRGRKKIEWEGLLHFFSYPFFSLLSERVNTRQFEVQFHILGGCLFIGEEWARGSLSLKAVAMLSKLGVAAPA